MNINELSDDEATVKTDVPLRHNVKKARIIIILVMIAVIISGIAVGNVIYKQYQHKRYFEGIASNDLLVLVDESEDDKLYSYDDTLDKLSYTAAVDYKLNMVQAQVLQGTVIDMQGNPINDHTLNFIYRYKYGEKWTYEVMINEFIPPRSSDVQYDIGLGGNIFFTSDREYQSSYLTDENGRVLDEDESLEIYEKYKEEINSLWDKLYAFFGEEHFKK